MPTCIWLSGSMQCGLPGKGDTRLCEAHAREAERVLALSCPECGEPRDYRYAPACSSACREALEIAQRRASGPGPLVQRAP